MDKYKIKLIFNLVFSLLIFIIIYLIVLHDFILRNNLLLKIIDIFLIISLLHLFYSIFKGEYEEKWILLFGTMRFIIIYFSTIGNINFKIFFNIG